MISFAGDNNSGVHSAVMQAIVAANTGHAVSYGDDHWTRAAEQAFASVFGDCRAFFVFTGTAANTLSIAALLRPWEAVICAQTAHINVHECGAPERFTGCRLLTLPTTDGKITSQGIESLLIGLGDEHVAQPRMVSITQVTELGTLYSLDELAAIADCCRRHNLYLHMDGARIANAVAALGCTPAELVHGVDVLSFGGTKNGLMCGEAVVFLRPEPAQSFPYIRKQGMQLASKMRFLTAQFPAYFAGDLWLRNAARANAMARLLARRVTELPGVHVTQPVDANTVLATLPRAAGERLLERYFFYWWNETAAEARWMTSFDTTEEHIEGFVQSLREFL